MNSEAEARAAVAIDAAAISKAARKEAKSAAAASAANGDENAGTEESVVLGEHSKRKKRRGSVTSAADIETEVEGEYIEGQRDAFMVVASGTAASDAFPAQAGNSSAETAVDSVASTKLDAPLQNTTSSTSKAKRKRGGVKGDQSQALAQGLDIALPAWIPGLEVPAAGKSAGGPRASLSSSPRSPRLSLSSPRTAR